MTDAPDLRQRLLDLIDGWLALREKGTAGEWRTANGKGAASVKGPECAIYLNVRTVEVDECVARWQADAEWIAASRSFAPLVLKALRQEIESHEKCGQRGPKVCSTCAISGEWPCAALRRVATSLGVEPEA